MGLYFMVSLIAALMLAGKATITSVLITALISVKIGSLLMSNNSMPTTVRDMK